MSFKKGKKQVDPHEPQGNYVILQRKKIKKKTNLLFYNFLKRQLYNDEKINLLPMFNSKVVFLVQG